MTVLGSIAAVVMMVGVIVLAVYALHTLGMALCFLVLRRRPKPAQPVLAPDARPDVLIQLPVFNERDVVAQSMRALAALDWPRDRLAIQVLDDSTDDTTAIARATAEELRETGLRIDVLTRAERTEAKAGALAAGLRKSDAPYVAVFDADFQPPADFLHQLVAMLEADPKLAFAQARWEHANLDHSVLTRAQAMQLDAHFFIEQNMRDLAGLPLTFNGTCGVWRRAAIDDAGGWTGDTLSEDRDLSYRAQLKGWRAAFRADVTAPGEIPEALPAWRQQQFRWSKGCMQVFVKLGGAIIRGPFPIISKLAALLHVGHSLVHPAALLVVLSAPAVIHFVPERPLALEAAAAIGLTLGISGALTSAIVTKRLLRRAPLRELVFEVPFLLSLSTGMALNNARAVGEALIGRRSPFLRTPKRGAGAGSYALRGPSGLAELFVAAWALSGVFASLGVVSPLLLVFSGGFLWIGLLSLKFNWGAARALRAAERAV